MNVLGAKEGPEAFEYLNIEHLFSRETFKRFGSRRTEK